MAAAIVPATVSSAPSEFIAEQSMSLEEVVVTARRRAESITDIGMDIQALSADQIERLRITSVEDLTIAIPSFTVAQSYQGVPTYTLRGIGFNTVNMSATSTVGTYLDEVAYPYPVMNGGPIFDLQRVEVAKGPQGTLFGRNTTAGLIHMVSNKPTKEFAARVKAEVGNYSTYNFEGMVNGPLSDNLQARVSLRTEDSNDGWQKSNTSSDTLGQIHRYGLRAAIAFQPTERLAFDFSYNGWSNQSDTLAAQAIGFTPSTADSPANAPGLVDYVADHFPDQASQADWAPAELRGKDIGPGAGLPGDLDEDSRLHAYKLHVAYELNDQMRLISLSSYQDMQRKGLTDWSGAPYEILLQDLDGEIESFSQEIRLEGSNDRVNWLLGGYYGRDDILDSNRTLLGENANVGLVRSLTLTLLGTPFNSGGYTALDAAQTFRTFFDRAEIENRNWSLFANADWNLTQRLSVTTGLRYSQDKQDYFGCSGDVNGSMLASVNVANRALFFQTYGGLADEIVEGGCTTFHPDTLQFGPIESSLDEDSLAWRLASEWQANDRTLLYASISSGTKSGVTPVNPANISTQNAPAKQEELLAYEIGVKATLFDQAMQFNASAFFYDYKDKQLYVFFADPIYTALSRINNVPDSEAYGLDTELTWRLAPGWTAIAAATFLHTEVIDYEGIDAAGQPANFDGAEFLYSPDFVSSLSLLYERDLSSQLGMEAALSGRYQSDAQAGLTKNEVSNIDSYGVVNASIGIHSADRRWGLSLWGKNLTDQYYWVTVITNANTVVRFAGDPLTYGASLTYNF